MGSLRDGPWGLRIPPHGGSTRGALLTRIDSTFQSIGREIRLAIAMQRPNDVESVTLEDDRFYGRGGMDGVEVPADNEGAVARDIASHRCTMAWSSWCV